MNHVRRIALAMAILGLSSAQAFAGDRDTKAPKCRYNEVQARVTAYEDRPGSDRVHVELQDLRGGERQSFDVAKPGHTMYSRYRVGQVVCRLLPEPPAGG